MTAILLAMLYSLPIPLILPSLLPLASLLAHSNRMLRLHLQVHPNCLHLPNLLIILQVLFPTHRLVMLASSVRLLAGLVVVVCCRLLLPAERMLKDFLVAL